MALIRFIMIAIFLLALTMIPAHAVSRSGFDEHQKLGDKIAYALNTYDHRHFSDLVNFDKLLINEPQYKHNEPYQKPSVLAEREERIEVLAKDIIDHLREAQAVAHFKRSYYRNRQLLLLVRIDYQQGFNFYEFLLAETPGEKYQITDIIAYHNGLKASKVIAGLKRMNINSRADFIHYFFSHKKLNKRIKHKMVHITDPWAQADQSSARAMIEKLPAKIDTSPIIQTLALNLAAAGNNDDFYQQQLAFFISNSKQQQTNTLLYIDHTLLAEQYDQAHHLLNQLNEAIGVDAALTNYRGYIYLLQNKAKKALKEIQKSIIEEPDYTPGYFSLGVTHLHLKEYRKAVSYFKLLEENFNYHFLPKHFKHFPDFQQSGDFIIWQGARGNEG